MKIDDYQFGRINIEGSTYENDVIVFSDDVYANWWRKEGHNLAPEDLKKAVEADPDRIVIGQGASGRMSVPEQTIEWLESQGIDVETAPTEDAVDVYNEIEDDEGVVGCFHLTC